ncbi:MAG: NAD(P)H-dependent flavin oxidoreductase, partial [Solirubrobacteraceae bacterium]
MQPPTARSGSRVAERIGLRLPLLQGPFGGGLSSIELVAAVSNAGALGAFGANLVPAQELGKLVAELRSHTDRPFNINLWVPLPGERDAALEADQAGPHFAPLEPYYEALGIPRSAVPPALLPDFDEQVEALLDASPPVISFVFGVPSADVLARAHEQGIVTIGTATTVDEAVALDEAGVDVVVASGSDGGGHRGSFLASAGESLVGTLSLVPQVVDAVSAPVVAAGGIADARQVTAAIALGAEAVQIGTAFLATDESAATPEYKALLAARPSSTVLTLAFTGRLARVIPNELTRALEARASELAR